MNNNNKSFLPKIEPKESVLDNGIKLYCFEDNTIPFIKLDMYFPFANTTNQDVLFSALATQKLITEGSELDSAKQIAEKIDYYGAYIEKTLEKEASNISFYFLRKYYKHLLPIVKEIITQAVFPQSELDLYKAKLTKQWQIDHQKTDYLARETFNRLLYGATHPYGISGKKEDIEALERQDLIDFYSCFYTLNSQTCFIVASGDIDNEITDELNSLIGGDFKAKMKQRNILPKSSSISTKLDFAGLESIVHLPTAKQASIRMGTITIGVNHPDYMKLNLLNSLFGGYFSSRLMQNIREDKGYTYGIGSYLFLNKDCSTFAIIGDIKQDCIEQTKEEIFKEMDTLSQTLIPQDELQRVKSYTKGEILRGLDGGFDLSEKFVPLLRYGMKNDYYDRYIQQIDSATAQDLQCVAQKYLHKEKMLTVIATN